MPARSECKQIRLVEIKPQLGRIWVRPRKKKKNNNVAKRLLEFKQEWEKYGSKKDYFTTKTKMDFDLFPLGKESRFRRAKT